MEPPTPTDHFDHLSTSWDLLRAAHDPEASPEQRQAARRQLVERYQDLVRRYLGGALRHERDRGEAVDDCLGKFSLRVMEGAFEGVKPERGRFRDYLRTCLENLVHDYHRERQRRRRQFQPLGGIDEPAVSGSPPVTDEEFKTMWRDQLVTQALAALEGHEKRKGQHLYTVLKYKMDHPDLRSAALANQLAGVVGKPVTAEWVRKRLYLARRRLAESLLQAVRQSLQRPTDEAVYQELAELGLLAYLPAARGEGQQGGRNTGVS
jgi:RNA polymerase sigma factor (sigma-70 family)